MSNYVMRTLFRVWLKRRSPGPVAPRREPVTAATSLAAATRLLRQHLERDTCDG
jgi:hypothetical protein